MISPQKVGFAKADKQFGTEGVFWSY